MMVPGRFNKLQQAPTMPTANISPAKAVQQRQQQGQQQGA